jgi:chemotaxis signal transduction protein
MDARGKIAYTDQPCVNGKEKKIITIQSDIDPSPSDKVGDVIERVKEMISFDKKEAKPDPEPAN